MKMFSLLFLLVVGFAGVRAQLKPGDYFYLRVAHYNEGGEQYLGVSPELRKSAPGIVGEALHKYPRRFRYILLNRSHFQNVYEKLYPDTNRINHLYSQSLAKDSLFMSYFQTLTKPFLNEPIDKATYGMSELMMVAARFFYCDTVREDSTIGSHICISLNGVKEASFPKDYTLLEAFCFEAIFENLTTPDNKPSALVGNFKKYIREGEDIQKPFITSLNDYLIQVRQYCFTQMEKDTALKELLLDYYIQHEHSLPFTIVR